MSDDRPTAPISGWYRDPTGQGDARFWDGRSWTDSVSRQGTTFQIPMDQSQRGVPPIPGTEFRATPPPAVQPSMPPSAPPSMPPSEPDRRSPVPAILGALVAIALIALVLVLTVSLSSDDDGDQDDTTEQTGEQENTGEQPEPTTEAPAGESTAGG